MMRERTLAVIMAMMILGKLSIAYRLSGKKIHVTHKGIPLQDIVDFDNRLDHNDLRGVQEALRPELLTENRDERLMLQQNGIEDFDTLDATVQEEEPPPKPIEAASVKDAEDEIFNRKAAALPEYNMETRADFERNQEAADWLTNNPNTYNIRSYEDTLSTDDPYSMLTGSIDSPGLMEKKERYEKNTTLRKPELHKHHQPGTIHKTTKEEPISDNNKGSYNDQMLYSFGDLNLKDEEDDTANKVEYTNDRNEDSYDGSGNLEDSENDWTQEPSLDNTDVIAGYHDENGDDENNRNTAPKSNENDDQRTEEETTIANADEGDYEDSPSHQKEQPPNVPRHRKKYKSKNANRKIFANTMRHDTGQGPGNDASGDKQLNIKVDSKTKTFHLGNMTIHISLTDHLKDPQALEGSSGTSGQDRDLVRGKGTYVGAPNIAEGNTQPSTGLLNGRAKQNERQPFRVVPGKAPDEFQLLDKNMDGKSFAGETPYHNTKSKSGTKTTDSRNELKELSEELKSMEELMALLQKNNGEAKGNEKNPSPAKGGNERSKQQRQTLSPMEQEESATKRKQESRPDAHDVRFSEWNGWSHCSATCGKGVVIRARACLIYKCPDKEMVQTKACITKECPGQWERDLLDAQNKLRAQHQSPPLEWSPSLATKAQFLADELARKQFITLSDLLEQKGENVAQLRGTGGDVAKRATDKWYGEIKSYSFSYPKFNEQTRHFVQMIWKGTKEVGMARARSPNGDYSFVVALYNPPANCPE